jgi:beta-xylosidase
VRKYFHLYIVIFFLIIGSGCTNNPESNKYPEKLVNSLSDNNWASDRGDGTYKNPIIWTDYSDPDVIRVGSDFYMTASSFNYVPGLPILHSKDLVNWSLVGYALSGLKPSVFFDKPQPGCGVWAPSIRFHGGSYWIFYSDPDQGIFRVKTNSPEGSWSDPVLVEEGKGLIDPCPFWENETDTSGAYLIHAFAGSRAGIKSILVLKRMNSDGTQTLDRGVMVFDGHKDQPTVEGPKLYKRNGYYYIFAPAGGVKTGWQIVLRSKDIYGPYEAKEVFHQGNTAINGPHQGAWVETEMGESWFIHFQDCDAFGRIVHLQPMEWKSDWPVLGIDQNSDGIVEPVTSYRKPRMTGTYPVERLNISDEFNTCLTALQWQWPANPKANWGFPSGYSGFMRLFAMPVSEDVSNLSQVPNLLLQKLSGPAATYVAKVSLHSYRSSEKAGLIVIGSSYAYIGLTAEKQKTRIIYAECINAFENEEESEFDIDTLQQDTLFFQVRIDNKARCHFGYSRDGKEYQEVKDSFTAKPGKWTGARIGFFCISDSITNNAGYLDIDWFRAKSNN